jgi:hypothetical protein
MIRLLAIATSACLLLAAPAQAKPPAEAEQLREIAVDAYLYAYPLVLMETTRRQATNVAAAEGFHAPMNQFAHMRAFPDPSFTAVVRPNADTLYSSLWFDVSREPLMIRIPDSGGRYYLMPMLDLWTDVFASPGARTTGTKAQLIALTSAAWEGTLPEGAVAIRAPTPVGWLIGRTQTNGTSDYRNVRRFQDQLLAVPLSEWGRKYVPVPNTVETNVDMQTPPPAQVDALSGEAFFALFAEVTKLNPPHANDYPILHRMQRLGIAPGRPFSLAAAPPAVQAAVAAAPETARARMAATAHKSGIVTEGWRTNLTAIGTYGADYVHRAAVASFGLGANSIEDAVYPSLFTDSLGQPLTSDARYWLHFDKEQLPPVNGFWSLTLYDERQLFAENPIDRYALGDRDRLRYNPDGSLDLYIQREAPERSRRGNWLPAPKSGPFTLNLRLYWPKQEVLDGTWSPPRLTRIP